MTLIFNEEAYALNLIENGFSKYISLRDLSILAKYYREEGYSFKKIENELIKFCKRYKSDFNIVRSDKLIKLAVSSAKNYRLRKPEAIVITENEIKAIRAVNNYPYEKVLFTMLVVAKFFKFGVKIKPSRKAKLMGYFVNVKQNDIYSLAKVRMNKKERNEMLHYFYCNGLIDTTYTGGLRICYADDNSSPAKVISEFDDITEYYLPLCIHCGKETENVKYKICPDCKDVRKKEMNRKRVKKSRNKQEK